MTALDIVLLASSALFAWSMGSHYSGAVMGAAYGARVISLGRALLLAAGLALLGGATASVNVIDTYAHGLVHAPPIVYVAAAMLASAIVTTISTYFRLPTSTIQIYTFSLLGAALVGGVPIEAAGFGLVIAGWVAGPIVAVAIGYGLGRIVPRWAGRGARALRVVVIAVSAYSAFTLGSNDTSNAAASLVIAHKLSPRLAGVFAGAFIALGLVTWGRRLVERVGKDIVEVDVPIAAGAQLAQAMTMTSLNLAGYNASINQTIVGGLVGAGGAQHQKPIHRRTVRNIVLTWFWSPLLGTASAALIALALRAIFGDRG